MRAMLVGVTTKGGTGGNARVDGFLVAGKTGTAQKVNPNGKGYLAGAYISSFGGFIPANDPRFVIYVAVDSPRKAYYGATVAAPLFSRVASYAVRKEGIAPLPISQESRDPAVVHRVVAESRVVKPVQAANDILALPDSRVPEEEAVPDLLNLTTREVLRRVSGQDIRVKFIGQGTVSEVVPAVGSQVPSNKEITVILK